MTAKYPSEVDGPYLEAARAMLPHGYVIVPQIPSEEMIQRAVQGFDCGTGDPNDYKRRMRFALEAALECSTSKNSI